MTRFATVREDVAVERDEVVVPRAAWRPVTASGVIVGLALFALGVVMGRITERDAGSTEADAAVVETAVLGAVEIAPDPTPSPTRIAPVATEHLVVVAISATTCGERASGTGVAIAPDTILTAAHVVGDAGLVRVDFNGQTFTAEVMGVFVDGRDLALIELPAPTIDVPSVGAAPVAGGGITIVGHPEAGPLTSVAGAAVEVPSVAAAVFAGDLVAVDATTEPGMSGGPAVDADGDLIGLLVGAQPGTGTAILSAIADVQELLEAPLTDAACPAFT